MHCFRCCTCGYLLSSDTNVLLLRGGSIRCSDCSSCIVCYGKIEDLVYVTDNEAICAACFTCWHCQNKIKSLKFARTSRGLSCMPCHSLIMMEKRQREALAEHSWREQAPLNSPSTVHYWTAGQLALPRPGTPMPRDGMFNALTPPSSSSGPDTPTSPSMTFF